jgi:hypothetical protein
MIDWHMGARGQAELHQVERGEVGLNDRLALGEVNYRLAHGGRGQPALQQVERGEVGLNDRWPMGRGQH